jgi:dTDP-4-amino-4,6-dideoxy-D-glucose acyltransferase
MSTFDMKRFKAVGINVLISDRVLDIRRPELITIGNHVAIDAGFYMTTAATIGDHIHIGPYVKVIGGAESRLVMGDFTNLAVGTTVICGSDTYAGDGLITAPGIPVEFSVVKRTTVELKRFANVAANVTIFPGVTLGEGSVIAAGSIVTKNTEPWTFYRGSPAKDYKRRPSEKMLEYAKKLGY